MARTKPMVAMSDTEIDASVVVMKARFGASWTWSQLADWILARGAELPEAQVKWARAFLDTRREQERKGLHVA